MADFSLPEIVQVEECYTLRSTILRPHQPKENWMFDSDHDADAIHMVIRSGDEVIAIVSILPEPHKETRVHPWRLRAMAVKPEFQRQHLGDILVQAVQGLPQLQGDGIWCTARKNVEGFYVKNGFVREGDEFVMNNMPHVRMVYTPEHEQQTRN